MIALDSAVWKMFLELYGAALDTTETVFPKQNNTGRVSAIYLNKLAWIESLFALSRFDYKCLDVTAKCHLVALSMHPILGNTLPQFGIFLIKKKRSKDRRLLLKSRKLKRTSVAFASSEEPIN